MAHNIFTGLYRIEWRDAHDNPMANLGDFQHKMFQITDAASGTEATYITDPQRLPKIPKRREVLGPYDKLVILVKPDTNIAVDVDDDGNFILVPVTMKNTRSGVVYPRTLTYADFTDKISADATLVSGSWYVWLEYQLGAQEELKLGVVGTDPRVDSALSLAWDPNITT